MQIDKNGELAKKMGKMFYNMLSELSNDIIKKDLFDENIRKHMFQYTFINFDELSEETKDKYITAGLMALQTGIDMFNFLIEKKER